MVKLKELQREQVRVLSETMVETEAQIAPGAESTEGEERERERSLREEGAVGGEVETRDTLTRVHDEGETSTEAEGQGQSEGSAPRVATEDEEMLSLD